MPRTRLILLPGLDGTGIMFRPLIHALPQTVPHTVHVYPCDRMLTYAELVSLVLTALPKGERYVLLGESFAGPLALSIAAMCPQGLIGVILCASFIGNPHPYIPGFFATMVRAPLLWMFPAFAQFKALLGGCSTPELRGLTSEALSKVKPAVLAHRIRSVLRVNVSAALQACPVPILYLRGTRDFVVPHWNLSRIHKARPNVHAEHLCAPHMVLQTCPEEAPRCIVSFINEVDGPRKSGNSRPV
jgi:pimeloyl-[acyl-carrier protein] methyl ester esterase